MKVMNHVTWRSMWQNRTRTLVTIMGVILSAAMFMGVCTLGLSMWQFLVDHETTKNGDHFIRFHFATGEQLASLEQRGEVSRLGVSETLGYATFTTGGSKETCVVAAVDESYLEMAPVRLLRGRMPESSSELVITENIYYYLLAEDKPCQLGDQLTLTIDPALAEWDIPAGTESYTASFEIVGVMERFYKINGENFNLSSLLTFADGNQPEPIWHTMLVKTHSARRAMELSDSGLFGTCYYRNMDLMGLYGTTAYSNFNLVIGLLCAVLIGIILVGSVSLIYNAFSISVAERTKQFGLLSSVGATRKQIRASVFFEGAALCLLGIPVGLLCGYGGICLTLMAVGDEVNYLMRESFNSTSTLKPVFSPLAAGAAALVGVLSVMLSAWIPARRATAIEPISAIRQTREYRMPPKPVKQGRLGRKLWGLPGLLGKKYYATTRSKYRSTVLSLVVSILLFMTAAAFGSELTRFTAGISNQENFDIQVNYDAGYDVHSLRELDMVTRSALIGADSEYGCSVRPEQLSGEYLSAQANAVVETDVMPSHLELIYLEDEVLRAYLEEKNIDPEPYFDPEEPMALLCDLRIIQYQQQEEDVLRTVRTFSPLTGDTERVTVYERDVPEEVWSWLGGRADYHSDMYCLEGVMVLELAPFHQGEGMMWWDPERAVYVEVESCVIDGVTCQRYYPFDAVTMERTGDAICTTQVRIPSFRVGQAVEELPYGVPSYGRTSLSTLLFVLPLSQMEGENYDLCLSTDDYEGFSEEARLRRLSYYDHLKGQRMYRALGVLIDTFANGFIGLISLICVCNVYNTVSTNIALRRRDFGVLRSVGMGLGQMHGMLLFECVQYSLMALLVGLPLGVGASWLVYRITVNASDGLAFVFPWQSLCVAVGSVLAVVLVSMLSSAGRIRQGELMEAIRSDSI